MARYQDKKGLIDGIEPGSPGKPGQESLQFVLSSEVFRFIAFIGIITLFASGKIISVAFIFTPNGTVDPNETAIAKLFGFNHLCNVVDFNPAKEVAAILVIFYSLPMVAFLILSHYEVVLAQKNGEGIPDWLVAYSRVITWLCIPASSLVHLWFVNSPQLDYPDGFGFIGHYLPYAAFQVSLSLIAVRQLHFYIRVYSLPFGVSVGSGKLYVRFVVLITVLCQACVFSIIFERPLLDSAAGGLEGTWERTAFRLLANVYAVTALIMPLFLSGWQVFKGEYKRTTIVLY